MHLTVTLPSKTRDLEIAERAARQNLWLWPLSPYYAGKASRTGFVLGFGGTRVEEIPPAVNILRKLLTLRKLWLSIRGKNLNHRGHTGHRGPLSTYSEIL